MRNESTGLLLVAILGTLGTVCFLLGLVTGWMAHR